MDKVVENLIQSLADKRLLTSVKSIYLFGSRARGDANERSDIDLAFDCLNIEQREWLDIIFYIEEFETLLKIDVTQYNNASDDLRARIDHEGIIVYEQGKSSAKPNES